MEALTIVHMQILHGLQISLKSIALCVTVAHCHSKSRLFKKQLLSGYTKGYNEAVYTGSYCPGESAIFTQHSAVSHKKKLKLTEVCIRLECQNFVQDLILENYTPKARFEGFKLTK